MQLESAYRKRNHLQNEPPSWYIRKGGKVYKSDRLKWLNFKDVDGEEATALVDVDSDTIVTLVKRGI